MLDCAVHFEVFTQFPTSLSWFLSVSRVSLGKASISLVVRLLEQFADHAAGLFARVEVDVAVTPFLF